MGRGNNLHRLTQSRTRRRKGSSTGGSHSGLKKRAVTKVHEQKYLRGPFPSDLAHLRIGVGFPSADLPRLKHHHEFVGNETVASDVKHCEASPEPQLAPEYASIEPSFAMKRVPEVSPLV